LSALDPEVAQNLFSACIYEYLGTKTRLFISNQLQFLKFCDTVVALRHGKVIEHGNFGDLAEKEGGEVYRLLSESLTDGTKGKTKEATKETAATSGSPAAVKIQDQNAGALVTKEERAVGAVPLRVYLKYIGAGGGALKFALVYMAFLLTTTNGTAITAWISVWTSNAPEYDTRPQWFYLTVYASLTVALGFTSFLATFMLVRFGAVAAETLHANLIDSVLRAPQSFFDTTPVGRILSRFSKDLYTIDIELTDSLDFTVFFSLQIVFASGRLYTPRRISQSPLFLYCSCTFGR
jgi:ABC-type multidrug transport system fused ATPase/permease subunit